MKSLDEDMPLRIEVWADLQSQWCYIEWVVLRRLVSELGDVDLKFRTYSQAPDLRAGQIQTRQPSLEEVAAEVGLALVVADPRPTSSQKGHELVHFASAVGDQTRVADRLFRAHFAEGMDIGSVEVLGRLAAECGLDRDMAIRALDLGTYSAEVEQDNHLAYLLGVTEIPFVVINRRYTLTGPQTPTTMRQALLEVRHDGQAGAQEQGAMDLGSGPVPRP